ncbi:MAG: MerR family transcriptional regulator [Coriobacteriales bacterium]|nr:MerR family transcriptional regulator [Coriobacteriales bacterium]
MGADTGKLYTIGEAAEVLGMPATTIRYYDKNGLIPNVSRTGGGVRLFDEDDLEWMRFVERLKVSGMPIREIREYIELYLAGDSTIEERRRIVYERRAAIEKQLVELELALDFISYKCWFYDVASKSGTCDTPRNMPDDELPDDIRRIKAKCRINRY